MKNSGKSLTWIPAVSLLEQRHLLVVLVVLLGVVVLVVLLLFVGHLGVTERRGFGPVLVRLGALYPADELRVGAVRRRLVRHLGYG